MLLLLVVVVFLLRLMVLQLPWAAMCGRSAFFLLERRVNLGLFYSILGLLS